MVVIVLYNKNAAHTSARTTSTQPVAGYLAQCGRVREWYRMKESVGMTHAVWDRNGAWMKRTT